MNQKVIYSMMAAVVPGAMVQAAVNVPVDQVAQPATPVEGGEGYELSISFGKIVPGKYTLTAMVIDGSVQNATIAGVNANIVGDVISATIYLTEETDVKLVATGANGFTIGTYLLKLDWNLDRTAWDALITSVNNKVGTTFNGKLTEAHKTEFINQITNKVQYIQDIQALPDAYETYAENELWKLSEGEDKISQAIKAIETAAEAQVIKDCWATKQTAYDDAVDNVPTKDRMDDLRNAINALTINKAERMDLFDEISGKVEDFMAAALEAKGSMAEKWEDAIKDEYEFSFDPDPTLDEILADLEELEGFVATDQNNCNRWKEMLGEEGLVAEAEALLETVDPYFTQRTKGQENFDAQKANIATELETYRTKAQAAYEEAIAEAGDEFDYDSDEAILNTIKDKIEKLKTDIEEDKKAYEEVCETIQGYINDANTYYSKKMTELSEAIPETEYSQTLENAQTALLALKNKEDEAPGLAFLTNKYATDGRELNPEQAKADFKACEEAMEDIVEDAVLNANKARFGSYQAEQIAAVENLAQEGDSDAAKAIIADAKAAIEALEYDEEKSLDENKDVVDEIVKPVANELAAQRDLDAFKAYQTEKAAAANDMAEDGDSDESKAFITEAVGKINALEYDEDKTLDENKAAVDDLVAQLEEDLLAQRAAEALAANKAVFENYKDEARGNFVAEDGDSDESKDFITKAVNKINALEYDEVKTLDENKAAVDEIVTDYSSKLAAQRAEDNAEAAAGELLDYMYGLVSGLVNATDGELTVKVKNSLDEVTGKMGIAEDEIQGKYTDLLSAISDVMTECDVIQNAVNEPVFEPQIDEETGEPVIDEETGEPVMVNTNPYYNNRKKVDGYNTLLSQIGKTNGNGLYDQFITLDTKAHDAVTAKEANDKAYKDLSAEVTALQTSLYTVKGTINELESDAEKAWVNDQVADQVYEIQQAIEGAQDVLNKANDVQTLNGDSKIDNKDAIVELIEALETTISEKEDAWDANEARYKELAWQFAVDAEDEKTSLQEKYDEVFAYINNPENITADVAETFAETLDNIQTQIDEAKNNLEEAYGNVELTKGSEINGLADIEAAITNVKSAADTKNAKYTANVELTTKYNEVNINLGEQRSLVVTAAGAGAAAYYRGLFNNPGRFVEKLGIIKDEIDANFNNPSVDPNDYKKPLLDSLTQLNNEINAVLPLAKANKASYDDQMDEYNKAVKIYNDSYTKLTTETEYEQEYVEAEIEAMEDYSRQLASVKDTIDTNYAIGAATEVENNVLQACQVTIPNGIQAILDGLDAENSAYNQAIAEANEQTLNEVLNKIQKIRETYNDAVAELSNPNYKTTDDSNEELVSTISTAKSELNTAISDAFMKQTTYRKKANKDCTAATKGHKIWDASDLMTEGFDEELSIADYIRKLEDATSDFTATVKQAIDTYWTGVSNNSLQKIGNLYTTLGTNRYIGVEVPEEDIFVDAYAAIEAGDALVDEEEGTFNVSELEDLEAGALSDASLVSVATEYARNIAKAAINEYTKDGGLKDEAWGAIVEVCGEYAPENVQPEGEDDIKTQFDAIVGTYITEVSEFVSGDDFTYETALNVITTSLANFDNKAEALVTKAEEWVKAKKEAEEQAELQLEEAKLELTDAWEALQDLYHQATNEFTELQGYVNQTSLANQYAVDLKEIQEKIENAGLGLDETLDLENLNLEDVTAKKSEVDAQNEELTDPVTGAFTSIEKVTRNVISDLKTNLKQNIPALIIAINEFAAAGGDDEKVDVYNGFIEDANEKTKPESDATLADMVKLEQDFAKMAFELGVVLDGDGGDLETTLTGLYSTLDDLLGDKTTLPGDKDYGNKTESFNKSLADIKNEASRIKTEMKNHEEAHDIAAYVGIYGNQVEAQQIAFENLLKAAEKKAGWVENNQAVIDEWKTALDEIITTTDLNPEISYVNYGENNFSEQLDNIKAAASEVKTIITDAEETLKNLEEDDENIESVMYNVESTYQDLVNHPIKQYKDLVSSALTKSTEWEDQKASSNEVYAELEKVMNSISGNIGAAIQAVGDYYSISYTEKQDYISELENMKSVFDGIKEEREAWKLTDAALDENDPDSYIYKLNHIDINTTWNNAALAEANARYFSADSELMKAKEEAWKQWKGWTFGSDLKTSYQTRLQANDNDLLGTYKFVKTENEDGTTTDVLILFEDGFKQIVEKATDAYNRMDEFDATCSEIKDEYDAIKDEMAGYTIAFGDANKDKKVNVLDYQVVTNMILNPKLQPVYENPKEDETLADIAWFSAIDVNESGAIEVGDLTAIVNYILDKNWQGYATKAEDAGVKGWMDDSMSESLTMTTSMTQQGTQRIAVNLQNVESYTAFQLDVLLPEGMTIVGQTLSDRAGNSHRLLSREQEDGSIRFLASSIKGETFSGSEGAVLYIDVETGANFNGGNVELLNILFSNTDAQTRAFAVDANGEATGISFMSTIESLKQKVYDLGGRMMNGMMKGINIIQGADGQAKKVLK